MKRSRVSQSLRSYDWKLHLRAPDSRLLDDLYVPALERAVRYDRCCAYFNSSVLSAAARGFAGLIQNILDRPQKMCRPAVRLLVNEQLDQKDVDALLSSGDFGPLIDHLLKQFKTPKDVLEKDRLSMLAWLAANGWLEVKVGLMRHEGGILHAKYGVFADARGNRLAFMGSGNETREGITGNYEELRLFRSWREREDADYYQERFETLWQNRDENVLAVPLPEAVEKKLIELAPDKPPEQEPAPDRSLIEAAVMWNFIAAAPFLPDGESACDATAPVDLWPHQKKVVDDTSRAFPCGRLLCDEVGMGKTIEAVIALRRLLCGRGVNRALLLVPASLLRQWQDELREKGGLVVPRWEDGYLYSGPNRRVQMDAAKALNEQNLLLVSREWARLSDNRELLLNAPCWDLVLMDEAHAARRRSQKEGEFNAGNLLLELLRDLQLRRKATGILLLSATPMQTQPWEPWDLLTVLGVGGMWMAEFRDIRTYYETVWKLLESHVDSRSAKIVGRLVESDPEFPEAPIKLTGSLESALISAMSDERKQLSEWLRKGSPLGRRMHRHTRDTLREYHRKGLLDRAPAERDVRDVVFAYESDAESDCYKAIKDYIDARFEQLEKEKSGKGFVMTIYRRRAASSPYAFRRSLERRLEACERVATKQWLGMWHSGDEDLDERDLSDAEMETEVIDPALPSTPEAAEREMGDIRAILDKLDATGNLDSKFARFREVLDDITSDGRPALVFTEYYDTLTYLRRLLVPIYSTTLGCFSGRGGEIWNGSEWLKVSKAEITSGLDAGKLRVLVCTDAASEGLNLQAASALINYDLPWNPSKVEQRIGRIDRIGQKQNVLPIRNLFLSDSVDMRVYQVLRERCGLFTHFVGRMQPVLALARDALRREQAEIFLKDVDRSLREIESDYTVAGAFSDSEAEVPEQKAPILTRDDLAHALQMLEHCTGTVSARRIKNRNSWTVRAAGRSAELSISREELERFEKPEPLSPGVGISNSIAEHLRHLLSRSPLVIAEASEGPFRAAEVRWVAGDRSVRVSDSAQLRGLLARWDGSPPSQLLAHRAFEQAKKEAANRVRELVRQARLRAEANVRNQIDAARERLRRELARTLRCWGPGDLDEMLREQANRSERYKRALELLGGSLSLTPEEVLEINEYVDRLTDSEKKIRITATEVDAALNDPRWRAL